MGKLQNIESGLVAVLLVTWFLFTATNVNATLGQIFAIFALASVVYILIDPQRDVSLKKSSDSTLGSIAVGAAAYVVLAIIGAFVIVPGVSGILDLLAASTPVLAQNVFINKLIFGVAVAATETLFFFVYGYDLIASVVGVRIDRSNLTNWKLWGVIIAISFAFMFFHLTAKGIGIDAVPTLVLVFFMSIISLLLVTWYKSGEQAVWFHIIANSLAIGLIPLPF